jgi:hypothetical protein
MREEERKLGAEGLCSAKTLSQGGVASSAALGRLCWLAWGCNSNPTQRNVTTAFFPKKRERKEGGKEGNQNSVGKGTL